MGAHPPSQCERVPYTAYYSSGAWSCQFRCLVCGKAARLNWGQFGYGGMLCDGSKIAPAPKRGHNTNNKQVPGGCPDPTGEVGNIDVEGNNMSTIGPYDEALLFIKRHPGTGGAGSLAKLILSLYNEMCGFSFAECMGYLDEQLTSLALRMVQDYAAHGETDDLRAAGKILADELYPRLWEMSVAMRDAREATRQKWRDEERKAELDELDAAEAALFTNPAKLIRAATAKELLDRKDPLSAYFNVAGDWRSTSLSRHKVHAAIDATGGAELSSNCQDCGTQLAVRIDQRVYYVLTDYDARYAYLEKIRARMDR